MGRSKIPDRWNTAGRGYRIPGNAVLGASDTGLWSDSPCPSGEVLDEIRRFRKEVLRPAGVPSRTKTLNTSNVFCLKRWVCVADEDWPRAVALAEAWLEENDATLRYLHDAQN